MSCRPWHGGTPHKFHVFPHRTLSNQQRSGIFPGYWICLAGSRSYTFSTIQGSLGRNFWASKIRRISRSIPKPATAFQMNQEEQDMECRTESQCRRNYSKKQNRRVLATTGPRQCESECATRSRQRHPTPVLLPGKSHGWRSLVGCSPWGR